MSAIKKKYKISNNSSGKIENRKVKENLCDNDIKDLIIARKIL